MRVLLVCRLRQWCGVRDRPAVSRTDKTDPYRVKVDRYGAHYWLPIYRCGCGLCTGWQDDSSRRRREGKRQTERWEREYR